MFTKECRTIILVVQPAIKLRILINLTVGIAVKLEQVERNRGN